jgi:hypothetical protein
MQPFRTSAPWASSEGQPTLGLGPLNSNAADQGPQQCAGKGKHGKGSPDGLTGGRGFNQRQALIGSGALILLSADEGFEIRHSISWATDW